MSATKVFVGLGTIIVPNTLIGMFIYYRIGRRIFDRIDHNIPVNPGKIGFGSAIYWCLMMFFLALEVPLSLASGYVDIRTGLR